MSSLLSSHTRTSSFMPTWPSQYATILIHTALLLGTHFGRTVLQINPLLRAWGGISLMSFVRWQILWAKSTATGYCNSPFFKPSCTTVFRTHTFYEGGGGELSQPPSMISKTVDTTTFNFGRPLGLRMRGKKLVELMKVLWGFHGNFCVRVFSTKFCLKRLKMTILRHFSNFVPLLHPHF